MYGERPGLRFFLALGLLSAFVLSPDRGTYPIAWVVGLGMAPMVLLELGAGLSSETRFYLFGLRCQVLGALLYVLLFFVGAAMRWPLTSTQWFFAGVGGGLGFVPVYFCLTEYGRAARREPLRPLRLPGPETGAWGRTKRALEIVGLAPILIGVSSLAFVVAAAWLLLKKPELAREPKLWLAALFFGSGMLVAISQGLDRITMGTGREIAARRFFQRAGFIGFSASLVLFGVYWDGMHLVLRGAFVAFGAVGLFVFVRMAMGGRAPRVYVLTRDGLLERTRRQGVLFPWESLASAELGELQRNVAVFVRLNRDVLPRVLWCRGDPERSLTKRLKAVESSQNWLGVDLAMMESHLEEGARAFFDRVQAGFDDEAARAELPPWDAFRDG